MLWIYRRNGQELRVETRLDKSDGRSVLRILWPDGREQFETFEADETFRRRLRELESVLGAEGWCPPAGPILDSGAEVVLFTFPVSGQRRREMDRRRIIRGGRRSRDFTSKENNEISPIDGWQKDEDS